MDVFQFLEARRAAQARSTPQPDYLSSRWGRHTLKAAGFVHYRIRGANDNPIHTVLAHGTNDRSLASRVTLRGR